MKRLIIHMMVSLDGFYEGPDHDLSWHNVDEEADRYAIDMLKDTELLIFGRRTYDVMVNFWPTQQALGLYPEVAGWMNSMPKIVCSRTLTHSDWNNTRILQKNAAEEISRLKQQPGGKPDILVMGSSNLALTLLEHNLADELRLVVNPVLATEGHTLFRGLLEPMKLKRNEVKAFANGNVALHYAIH